MKTLVLVILFAVQGAIPITRPGSITGRLLQQDGSPAVDTRVFVVAMDEGLGAQALVSLDRTDKAGRFRLEGIPAGRYIVAGGALDSPSYFPGVTARSSATVVNVVSGATITGLDFRLMVLPPLRVSGRVTFEPTTALIPRVLLLTTSAQTFSSASIAADGSFAFENVRPGNYRIMLSDGLDAAIVVEDRSLTGLELRVRASVSVSHTINLEDEGPLPAFELVLTDRTTSLDHTVIREGSAALVAPLRTADYRIEARGLPPGFFIKSMRSGSRDLLTQLLEVRAGTNGTEIAITLGISSPPPWIALNGRVTGPGANHIRQVKAVGRALQGSSLATVLADGSFRFPKLLPGIYTLTPFPPSESLSTSVTGNIRNASAPIELFTYALKPVPGRVILEGDVPLPLGVDLDIVCPRVGETQEIVTTTTVGVALDGTFTGYLPTAGCQVGLAKARPGLLASQTYIAKASYGAVDLLAEQRPFFTFSDSNELRITLTTQSLLFPVKGTLVTPDPLVRRIVFRASSGMLTPIDGGQAAVAADGSFALSLPSGSYKASIDAGSVAPVPELTVTVPAPERVGPFIWPRFRRIVVRMSTDDGPLPVAFSLLVGGIIARQYSNSGNSSFVSGQMEFHGFSIDVVPRQDGTFEFVLPQGQYSFTTEFSENEPVRHRVKSVTASPLIVADQDLEITIVFEGRGRE